MGILQNRCANWCHLRKWTIGLISFAFLVTVFVYHAPVFQQEELLLGPFKSTCSHAADRRGPNQRIVTYSLYGNFSREDHVKKYVIPFGETLKSVPSIYPGWTVRIYLNLPSDDTASWETLNRHLEIGSHVDVCNVTEVLENRNLERNPSAATWRWLTMLDDMVDTIMSRDTDSHIIPREEDAVREWLDSDKVFHIMRDHPYHCVHVLAGMWGVKLSQDRPHIAGVFHEIFKLNHNHNYGYDQALLTDYIWPFAQFNMVSHDSYCCRNFPYSKPYPTPRSKDGLFIGGRDDPAEALTSPCPVECRPVNASSDWDYC